MGVLDLLTGNAYKKAAKNNAAAIQQGVTAGSNALTQGANNAIDTLGTRGQGNALAALGGGYQQARNDLTAGFDGAQPALAKLGSQYGHMVQGGQAAFDRYLDAIGANGAEGNARASAAFRSSPGYEFALNQGLGAIQARAAASGSLASGNTTADMLKFATGLADQNFSSYLGGLQSGAGYYGSGLTGQSQGLGAQANASIGEGTALAQLGQSSGRDQANIYGTAANVQNGLGTGVANLWSQATANQINNNNMLAKGQTDASGSILGGILGGAQSIFGAAGQAGGFSNLFK